MITDMHTDLDYDNLDLGGPSTPLEWLGQRWDPSADDGAPLPPAVPPLPAVPDVPAVPAVPAAPAVGLTGEPGDSPMSPITILDDDEAGPSHPVELHSVPPTRRYFTRFERARVPIQ